ncbi:minor capsid protein [Campylobacter canadensis]|nr:minor capsid protein [Campylobacter canadensis]
MVFYFWRCFFGGGGVMGDKPYLRYVAIMDNRVRDSHKAFHGLILPKEHSFWRNNYPPNGWGCRCKTQVLSLDEAKALGYKENVKDKRSSLNAAVRGFDNNPIEPNNALFKVLEEKVKSAPEELREQAKKIMNSAFKDTQEHTKRYSAIKDRFDYHQKLMKAKGLAPLEYKKFINHKVGNFDDKQKAKREQNLIKLCEYKGKGVFIDEYQIANHFYHTNIGAVDYSLVPQILKGTDEKGNKAHSIVYKNILGFKYKLVIKDTNGKIYVESLTKDGE